ncbi:flagellar hook-associated protein FlgK [Alkalibacillus aidingensis]|uniref:flagellar hook-associated protein FlgK n=1 Tax=Alkalibacillus aidingensis TaxID=2747607 RepID=UPI001660FCC5|nr:flagellar hook-associated protein FlgK [Alkalibacillus aidingensis]
MTSTFHGLEVARRSLFTQQSALHTTGHNIANANTEGYSRQRVNFEQTSPYPAPARNAPEIPGQLGTGVKAGEVERVREQFLDFQYRAENNKAGYWDSRSDSLRRMEDIMNEPSDSGLANTFDQFWESIQDVATNPEDGGARRVMQQRAEALTDTFHYQHEKLTDVQGELKNEMDTNSGEVNTLINQIHQINDQIERIEPNGHLPNDLYDQRDVLIDELSEFVNIEVSHVPSGGNSKDIAEGKAVIRLIDDNGNPIDGGELINEDNDMRGLEVQFDHDENSQIVNGIGLGDINADGELENVESMNVEEFTSPGKLQGLIDANGYVDQRDGTEFKGDYVEMIDNLNELAYEFSTAFNEQHQQGYNLHGDQADDYRFFDQLDDAEQAAALISVSDEIKNDENNIAASSTGDPGDGGNALALSDVRDTELDNGQSIQKFYEGMVGELGVRAQEANRMASNTADLRESVDENRESVSGVSLDEEMSNMIKFQHAYNAAARNMTVVDEMLDRVINQMGVVGR